MKRAQVILIGESPREKLSLSEAAEALDHFDIAHVEVMPDASVREIEAAAGARIAIVAVSADPSLVTELAEATNLAVIAIPLTEKALYRLNERTGHERSPAAIVAIGGSYNAGILAAQFHASASENGAKVYGAVRGYKQELRRKVLSKKI